MYNARTMDWIDQLHRLIIGVSDVINRIDVDSRLLAASEVKLDRALFPLLSRIAMHEPLNTVDLANLVGRDHSTVSRQVAKLEECGLIERVPAPNDRRARMLVTSKAARDLMSKVTEVRRRWMEEHFSEWSQAERDQLIRLMTRMMEPRAPSPFRRT